MRIPKFDRPTTVFFAVTLVSIGLLAYPMWNYTKYYLALWSFDYTVSNVTLDKSQTNWILTVKLLFTNPVDYSGLELTYISVGLEYVNPLQAHRVLDPNLRQQGVHREGWVSTNVWELKVQTFALQLPVAAYANETVDLNFAVNPYVGTELEKENAMAFIGFMDTHPDQVRWELTCYLALSSFLGGYAVSRYLSYETLMASQ